MQNRKPSARGLVAARQRRQKELPPTPASKELKVVGKEPPPAAVASNDAYVDQLLDALAPSGIVGRLAKFDPHEGRFFTTDDGKELPKDAEYAVPGDQILHGHMRFNGKGVPPTRKMGLLFSDFRLTQIDDLPDRDESQWELGLNGRPADPWPYHYHVVLQDVATDALYTFDTSSDTGVRSVVELIRHYKRMRDSGDVPVVRLGSAGFMNKDPRVGWCNKPAFIVVGRRPANSIIQPDTSTGGTLDDAIPDFDKE